MQIYPNNGFISYWRYLTKTTVFDNKTRIARLFRLLQTGIKLTGLVLKDAGIELLFVLLFWAIMTQMSQGRDLIVSFFEPNGIYTEWRVLFTVLSVVSFSVSMWIIPAFLFQKRDRQNNKRRFYRSIFTKHLFFVHRVLPLIPFWLLAYTIFNGAAVPWGFTGLSLFALLLLFVFNSSIKTAGSRRIYFAILFILFLIAAIIFSLVYRKTYLEAKVAFAFVLYLLSFLMYLIYHKVDQEILAENEKPDDVSVNTFKKYKVNSSFYAGVFIIHLVCVSIIFAMPRLFTTVKIAPESMLLYIFSLNTFMIDLFVYLVNINPRIKFVAIAVLVVIVLLYASPLAQLNLRHYTVDANADPSILKGKERLSFEDRYNILKDSIRNYKGAVPYPIILISGEGGGSRAGMWFSQNLINFDLYTNGRFRNYIFSMSTVSGSSVGLGTVFSFWNKTQKEDSISDKWRALPSIVYSNNFVGSSIRGLLLTDFWKTIIPGNWTSDRNSVLQDEESYYTQKACDELNGEFNAGTKTPDSMRILKKDFMNFFYYVNNDTLKLKADVPLVFINTCRSNDGRRGIFSPIKLSTDVFNDAIDINGYLYDDSFCDVNDKKICSNIKKNISFEQACNTSELFPLFSAPAYIDSLGSFVDGGYHENSGLKTTLDVYEKLKKVLANDTDMKNHKYKIYIIYLKNGSGDKNLYKPLPSEPPLTLPLKALSSQPFEGSESYFEEKTKFVDTTDNLVKYLEIKLDNKLIIDKDYLFPDSNNVIQKQILQDLETNEKDSTLNFPLARWLSKSVLRRIRYDAYRQMKRNDVMDLLNRIKTDGGMQNNLPSADSSAVIKHNKKK